MAVTSQLVSNIATKDGVPSTPHDDDRYPMLKLPELLLFICLPKTYAYRGVCKVTVMQIVSIPDVRKGFFTAITFLNEKSPKEAGV